MTNDIVSTISRYLTPEIVGKLAAATGLDSATAQKAVAAAVPALLSCLAGIAARPGGARQLATAVADQPTDILGSMATGLTGTAQMAERGTSLLSSLLGGGGSLGMLASAVSKFVGTGEGSTRTLMGLLMPVIMSVLGREQRGADLDANGLARMLTDQKDQIAAAMPSGLTRLLDTSGLREQIGSTSSADWRTRDAPRATIHDAPPTGTMHRAASDATTARSGSTWPYWVLPLLALGGLLWYMLPDGRDSVETTRMSDPKGIYLTSAPDNWVSIGATPNEFVNRDIHNRAGEKLGTVKDVLVGPEGRMTAIIVSIGRELGLGDKDVAIPFTALQLEQSDTGRRIVVDAKKETVQTAPAFERRPAPKKP